MPRLAAEFMHKAMQDKTLPQAAAFRFALDDDGLWPRMMEKLVKWRCTFLCTPYGDQGLLISKQHYREIGGFRDLPLMEDIDLVRRLKCRGLKMLPSKARTSAARYRKEGYLLRSGRNLACLVLYFLKVPPRYLVRFYG